MQQSSELHADPKQIAIHSQHEQISRSFAELQADVQRLAGSLHAEFGLRRGDVIALWSANCYSWLVIQYAAARLGLILCTLNPVYKADELQFALQKSGAKLLFMPGERTQQAPINQFCEVFAQMQVEQTSLQHVVLIDGQLDRFKAAVGVHRLAPLVERPVSATPTDEVNADDPAIIMFTSVS